MEYLKELDQQLFLWLNAWHTHWLDPVMSLITGRLTWLPLYIGIVAWIFFRQRKTGIWTILAIALAVTLADQVTSGVMKPLFERLRPCHDPTISALVHVVGGCGGRFGFASSHAANTFALATLISLLHPGRRAVAVVLLTWAAVVSYSRIYVGVHYPGDIVTGALIGSLIAYLVYRMGTQSKLLKHI